MPNTTFTSLGSPLLLYSNSSFSPSVPTSNTPLHRHFPPHLNSLPRVPTKSVISLIPPLSPTTHPLLLAHASGPTLSSLKLSPVHLYEPSTLHNFSAPTLYLEGPIIQLETTTLPSPSFHTPSITSQTYGEIYAATVSLSRAANTAAPDFVFEVHTIVEGRDGFSWSTIYSQPLSSFSAPKSQSQPRPPIIIPPHPTFTSRKALQYTLFSENTFHSLALSPSLTTPRLSTYTLPAESSLPQAVIHTSIHPSHLVLAGDAPDQLTGLDLRQKTKCTETMTDLPNTITSLTAGQNSTIYATLAPSLTLAPRTQLGHAFNVVNGITGGAGVAVLDLRMPWRVVKVLGALGDEEGINATLSPPKPVSSLVDNFAGVVRVGGLKSAGGGETILNVNGSLSSWEKSPHSFSVIAVDEEKDEGVRLGVPEVAYGDGMAKRGGFAEVPFGLREDERMGRRGVCAVRVEGDAGEILCYEGEESEGDEGEEEFDEAATWTQANDNMGQQYFCEPSTSTQTLPSHSGSSWPPLLLSPKWEAKTYASGPKKNSTYFENINSKERRDTPVLEPAVPRPVSYTPSYSAKPLLLVFSMSSAGSVFLHVIIEDSSGKLKGVRDENNAVGCVSLPVVSRRNGGVHKRITPSSRKLSNTSGAIRVELCNRVFNSGVNPNWFKKDDGSIDVWRDDLMKLDDGRVRKEMRLRGMDEMDKASDEERLRSLVESMRRDEEVQSLMHGCEYPAECRMVAQPYNVCAVKESLQGTGAGRVAEEGGLKGGRGEEFDWEVEGAEKEGEGGREERVSINADLLRLHKEAWQKAAKEIVEEGEEGEEGDDM